MARFSFKGGVHPYDGKDLSKDKPIREILPKGDLVYPLSQHIGAPAAAIVNKGDYVRVGQKIAEASGFVSSPIYATVSGTVKAIEPRRVVAGQKEMSIVVENDSQYQEIDWPSVKPYEQLSREEKLEMIKEAGIVGLGGAGFPTFIKLSPKEPEKIDYVIVNCAECEPYLTSDYRRMIESPEQLVSGLLIALSLFDNAKGILAIEDNKPDCIDLLTKQTKEQASITVKSLKTKYPQGSERQLIYAATGRAINSSMLPADAGCVVINVETAVSIHRAVKLGRPLMHKIITVTGDAIANPCNLRVKIGASFQELIDEAGGFKEQPKKLIAGGPMMGVALFDLNVPVIKTSSALLCLTKDDVAAAPSSACINCGKCVSVCPGRIMPSKLAVYAEHNDEEAFLKNNGMECCECGCCSYICPAKRPLTQLIKSMRKMQLAKKKK